MANLAVVHQATPDQRFTAYLDALDDDIVACKAGHHNIPKLKPGKLPKGTEVRRRKGGVYQVTVDCLDCGLPATLTTGKGGVLDPEEHWTYDYAAVPGYLAPKGTGRAGRKAAYKVELGIRVAADIRQAAVGATGKTAAEKRAEAARKAAKTPKAPRGPHNEHATNPRARRMSRDGERRMQAEREVHLRQNGNGATA